MIAATLGPVASAFSICALVSPWRQHLVPGKSLDDATIVTDPAWYVHGSKWNRSFHESSSLADKVAIKANAIPSMI